MAYRVDVINKGESDFEIINKLEHDAVMSDISTRVKMILRLIGDRSDMIEAICALDGLMVDTKPY